MKFQVLGDKGGANNWAIVAASGDRLVQSDPVSLGLDFVQ